MLRLLFVRLLIKACLIPIVNNFFVTNNSHFNYTSVETHSYPYVSIQPYIIIKVNDFQLLIITTNRPAAIITNRTG